MREGRVAGAVLGVGALAGALVLLRLSRRASAMTTGSPRDREYPRVPPAPSFGLTPYEDRLGRLLARGAQGERWRGALARTAPPGYADWIDAVVRWVGIESGGDPTNVTGGKELGLLQINRAYAAELGFSPAELDRYVARSTSDDDRARTSWRYVRALDVPVAHVATPDPKARAWVTYMKHALPLALHELAAQGFLTEGPASPRMDAAWESYRPSPRAQGYATTKTGTSAQQVLLRFAASADAVAGYDRSSRWTPQRMVA